jgi:hypothetical protein
VGLLYNRAEDLFTQNAGVVLPQPGVNDDLDYVGSGEDRLVYGPARLHGAADSDIFLGYDGRSSARPHGIELAANRAERARSGEEARAVGPPGADSVAEGYISAYSGVAEVADCGDAGIQSIPGDGRTKKCSLGCTHLHETLELFNH